jgi:hypothetical protein
MYVYICMYIYIYIPRTLASAHARPTSTLAVPTPHRCSAAAARGLLCPLYGPSTASMRSSWRGLPLCAGQASVCDWQRLRLQRPLRRRPSPAVLPLRARAAGPCVRARVCGRLERTLSRALLGRAVRYRHRRTRSAHRTHVGMHPRMRALDGAGIAPCTRVRCARICVPQRVRRAAHCGAIVRRVRLGRFPHRRLPAGRVGDRPRGGMRRCSRRLRQDVRWTCWQCVAR